MRYSNHCYYECCRRCGVERRINTGKKRREGSTGLCRDCFNSLPPANRNRSARAA